MLPQCQQNTCERQDLKSCLIHASVIIRFPEFAEFSEFLFNLGKNFITLVTILRSLIPFLIQLTGPEFWSSFSAAIDITTTVNSNLCANAITSTARASNANKREGTIFIVCEALPDHWLTSSYKCVKKLRRDVASHAGT